MRLLIIFFLAFICQGQVQANEYAKQVVNFCKNHKGLKVKGGGCNDLIYGIMRSTHTKGYFKGYYKDSVSISVGDYLYFDKVKNDFGYRMGAHYVVVLEVNGTNLVVAEQDPDEAPYVSIVDYSIANIVSGNIEIYGFKHSDKKVTRPKATVKKYKNGKLVKSKTRGNHFNLRSK